MYFYALCAKYVQVLLNMLWIWVLWCGFDVGNCNATAWGHTVWVWVNSCTEEPCSCLKDRVKSASPAEGTSKPATEESSEKGKSSSSSATASGPSSGFTLGRPQAAKGRIPEADVPLSSGESQCRSPPFFLLFSPILLLLLLLLHRAC